VLILGIESATVQVGCAIGGHEGVLAQAHSARGKRHAETLTPTIDFVRRTARVNLSDISVIAVDLGPGLYTGLRVGVASAKALAQALRLPMIGISSLDLLAFPVRFTARTIVTCIDARRGEVFYALYRQVPGGVQRLSPHQVGTPGDVASELFARREETLIVGDGAIRYAEVFEDLERVEVGERGLMYPSAASLVQLAHARALREQWVRPWDLHPLYLRLPDAEINWSVRDGAA
jgi:tRNA threonylcarbamoyladenosine biosynthesis protein TsaB